MQLVFLSWCFIVAATEAAAYQFPNLTGPLPVGTTALEVIDYSRTDPLAPSPRPRALMISLFYPTTRSASASGKYTIAPDFPPATATFVDQYINVPEGTTVSIYTQSYLNAPLASSNFPVLLFGPGFGGSRLGYTAQLEDLASHGWIIVAVDHTYDALVVKFPDGTLVQALTEDPGNFPGGLARLTEIRAEDLQSVVSALKNATVLEQIPALKTCNATARLHLDQVGAFGHSLGGATAAQAMLDSDTFTCGANFDGSLWGEATNTSLDKPFLQVSAAAHNQTNDASWAEFWEQLKRFRREIAVNGTVHYSFSDIPLIRDILGDVFPANQSSFYGSLTGERLIEIETATMDAFFGYCFKGRPSSDLDNLVGPAYPELFFNS
ncbi:putative Alpha/Beta hydrolase protein [Seiridium unicorne]|uniref:1-alkyl-2-acetylglycerophosphocholine esterase n=1 Tax=Seiridium unicorne TaxID=138068 RepID=A0ABR2UXZ1_9PEZI